METLEMIREEAARAAAQLFEVAKMKEGELLVVGCSSSEIGAEKIGTHSSAEIGQAVFEGIKGELDRQGVFLAAQCCEHLNRALILERAAAEKYGYDKLHFQVGDIGGYETEEQIDMVISLHACDTATDYALYHAIRWKAKLIFSVPCCQHELNKQMKSDNLSILTRYGIVKERTAALMTDAIRGNLLTESGYRTQLLEFVDLSHTPKNLLIRAVRSMIPASAKKQARAEVDAIEKEFGLQPTLDTLLHGKEA